MDEKYCVLCKQLQGNCAWFCLSCLRRLEKTSPYPYPRILWDGLDNLKDWTLTENTVREYEKSTNIYPDWNYSIEDEAKEVAKNMNPVCDTSQPGCPCCKINDWFSQFNKTLEFKLVGNELFYEIKIGI